MKILKTLLFAIVAIVAIILIVAAFVKKDFNVTREVVINKPHSEVWEYTKYLKNQDNFSVWANIDPGMQKSYEGEDGQVGFVSAWVSTNDSVGSGAQEITKIDEGKRIDYELRFKEPMEATNYAYLEFTPLDSNRTKVVWGFSGSFPYPTNIMLLMMDFDGMIGKDFAQGLENLKGILEKQ